MKLTVKQLKKLIKEEVESSFNKNKHMDSYAKLRKIQDILSEFIDGDGFEKDSEDVNYARMARSKLETAIYHFKSRAPWSEARFAFEESLQEGFGYITNILTLSNEKQEELSELMEPLAILYFK